MADQMIPCTACPDPSLIGQRIAFCSGCGQQRFYGKGPCMSCGTRGPASCATCDDRGFLPMPHTQGGDMTTPADTKETSRRTNA